MTQHSGLTLERWRHFNTAQQVLMMGNEMNRASKLQDSDALRRCYQRVLRLADLTVQATDRQAFRREMLLWRDCIAEHRRALRRRPARSRAPP